VPLTSPAADEEVIDLDAPLEDDALRLLFLCCHPALNSDAQIALTLRTVGGLTTPEIARAFLVPESTMAQRLVRAKRKIALAGIPFRLPDPGEEMVGRTAAVLHVVYLVFNEGYAATGGDELVRTDLCTEAVRLAALLQRLLPDDAEVSGLLALLILHDARRSSRTDPAGRLVPLDEQDRSLWDRVEIARGVALVERSLAKGPVGPYQVQAAIAAIHAEAEDAVLTDWDEIVALYSLLERLSPGPLVSLNRAVAVSMRDGPEAGLAALDALDPAQQPDGSHRLPAARAHLLERLDRLELARQEYARAAELADTRPEREYLLARLDRLG
jgi:predicted RNA polymerase sigma factor